MLLERLLLPVVSLMPQSSMTRTSTALVHDLAFP